MKRSLTISLAVLLALTSCGTMRDYSYSDSYLDGIYSYASGAHKQKAAEEAAAASARLAGDLSMNMLSDSPYLYDSPNYNPYFNGRTCIRVYPWISLDLGFWGPGFSWGFRWGWPYRYDPFWYDPFWDPVWYRPWYHPGWYPWHPWRPWHPVGPVYPVNTRDYKYIPRGAGSSGGGTGHAVSSGSTAGRAGGGVTNFRPGSTSGTGGSGTRTAVGSGSVTGSGAGSITNYRRSGSGGSSSVGQQQTGSGAVRSGSGQNTVRPSQQSTRSVSPGSSYNRGGQTRIGSSYSPGPSGSSSTVGGTSRGSSFSGGGPSRGGGGRR